MKMRSIISTLILALSLVACNPKQTPSSQNDTTEIAKDPVDTALTHNTMYDGFAEKAAIGGMMEVESSAKMIKFTENPDIQTLATMMVKDHGMANKELEGIANKQQLNLPQTLPSDKLEELKKLDELKEEELNRYYAALMVKEHREAVALFTSASQTEPNGTLKAFALKHLPTLKAHLLHAETVNKMIESIRNDRGDQPLKTSKDRKQK
jgi:putative membrane protein